MNPQGNAFVFGNKLSKSSFGIGDDNGFNLDKPYAQQEEKKQDMIKLQFGNWKYYDAGLALFQDASTRTAFHLASSMQFFDDLHVTGDAFYCKNPRNSQALISSLMMWIENNLCKNNQSVHNGNNSNKSNGCGPIKIEFSKETTNKIKNAMKNRDFYNSVMNKYARHVQYDHFEESLYYLGDASEVDKVKCGILDMFASISNNGGGSGGYGGPNWSHGQSTGGGHRGGGSGGGGGNVNNFNYSGIFGSHGGYNGNTNDNLNSNSNNTTNFPIVVSKSVKQWQVAFGPGSNQFLYQQFIAWLPRWLSQRCSFERYDDCMVNRGYLQIKGIAECGEVQRAFEKEIKKLDYVPCYLCKSNDEKFDERNITFNGYKCTKCILNGQ